MYFIMFLPVWVCGPWYIQAQYVCVYKYPCIHKVLIVGITVIDDDVVELTVVVAVAAAAIVVVGMMMVMMITTSSSSL